MKGFLESKDEDVGGGGRLWVLGFPSLLWCGAANVSVMTGEFMTVDNKDFTT